MNVRKAMLVRSVDSVDPGVRRDALRIADEVKDVLRHRVLCHQLDE